MIRVLGYGCTTAAGDGVASLWSALSGGVVHAAAVDTSKWPVRDESRYLASLIPDTDRDLAVSERLARHAVGAWKESGGVIAGRRRYGLLFASSKGAVEDTAWSGAPEADPFASVIENFLRSTGMELERVVTVSNACSSSHAALYLATQWLRRDWIDEAVVIAADGVGPFVLRGFGCLRALSSGVPRPFSGERDGLRLGEAAACIRLAGDNTAATGLRLAGLGLDNEGHAATRPEATGHSLARAVKQALGEDGRPDVMVAHATATVVNDAIEDRVLGPLSQRFDAPITATKWCIGHTLGVSGLIDTIAAAEILRRGRAFRIATTSSAQADFVGRYLFRDTPELPHREYREALVTSLGFGGVHAAVRLAAREGGEA